VTHCQSTEGNQCSKTWWYLFHEQFQNEGRQCWE